MKTWTLLAILLIVNLSGCATTVTPPHVIGKVAAFDASTPRQYNQQNNGFLGYVSVKNEQDRRALLTPNCRNDYNNLILKYQAKFRMRYAKELTPDIGIEPYTDQYGNRLFVLDKERLGYFQILCMWQRADKGGDTLLNKIMP